MSGSGKERYSWYKRLNARWPWLKIGLMFVLLILVAGISNGWWIPRAGLNEERTPKVIAGLTVEAADGPPRAKRENYVGKKLVALTFDDGPSGATTPKLLDILKEKQVFVTFFVLGKNAEANPEIVKREAREGHEVESHTMYHQKLGKMTDSAVAKDINEANSVITEITGNEINLIRPPYGMINQAVRNQAKVPLALWTVDTLDWQSRNASAVKREIMSSVFDGAVVLMHDIYESTVEAVRISVDELREEGYEFVTFSDLAKIRDAEMQNGVAYGSFRP